MTLLRRIGIDPLPDAGRVISVEDWAEIRLLPWAWDVLIKQIARRLGIARNTVRAALGADEVPRRDRGPRVRLADAVENQLWLLLAEWPTPRRR
jgi:hypothetical protein